MVGHEEAIVAAANLFVYASAKLWVIRGAGREFPCVHCACKKPQFLRTERFLRIEKSATYLFSIDLLIPTPPASTRRSTECNVEICLLLSTRAPIRQFQPGKRRRAPSAASTSCEARLIPPDFHRLHARSAKGPRRTQRRKIDSHQ
jgi:hypothetical protein